MSYESGFAIRITDRCTPHPAASSLPLPARANGSTMIGGTEPFYERLRPDNTAVLLIDHQIGPLWELDFAETRRRVAELAYVAKRMQIPTIITAIALDTWGSIIPELAAVYDDAPHVVRNAVNAWDDFNVRTAFEAHDRKKLIIAGSTTEIAVTLCALSAVEAGYQVYAPLDASGHTEHGAVASLSRAGVIVTTTALVTKEITTLRR
jgi:nicotinamidase-related amidase